MTKILVLTFFLAGIGSPAGAAVVYYYDETGQIHYVNTDYQEIPERYLPQVKDQLPPEPSEEPPSEEPSGGQFQRGTSPLVNPYNSGPLMIDVFVGPDCPACAELEVHLYAMGVEYNRYDIRYDNYGKQLVQGMPLPVVRIGQRIISPADIDTLRPILRRQDNFY